MPSHVAPWRGSGSARKPAICWCDLTVLVSLWNCRNGRFTNSARESFAGFRRVTVPQVSRDLAAEEEGLVEGIHIGRFIVLRDVEGNLHAVAAAAIAALCETDDWTLLMLPGGRLVQVQQDLGIVLSWLV